jgi:hypothetical protein
MIDGGTCEAAGTSFGAEFCAFIDNQVGNANYLIAFKNFPSQGKVFLEGCVFRGNGAPARIFNFGRTDCTLVMFDCFVDGQIPTKVAPSHFFRNIANYQGTITLTTSRTGNCHIVKIDERAGLQTRATGELTNNWCIGEGVSEDQKHWNGLTGEQGYRTRIEKVVGDQECCNINRCTFADLTAGSSGGAIAFVASGPWSSVTLTETQFTRCQTSQTVELSGGALYIEVGRFDARRSCAAQCSSHLGTFLAAGPPSTWIEFAECTLGRCDSQQTGGGAVIAMDYGPFKLEDTNFSECQQPGEAAILRFGAADTDVWNSPLSSSHLTCYKCSGTAGFCFRCACQITHLFGLYVDCEAVPLGWYTLERANLVLKNCMVLNFSGLIF